MKTTVEELDPVKVKLTVEVEPERVKQAFDRAAKDIAQQVNLPGFRPGKAPRRMIEQRVGKETIAQQAMQQALDSYYAEALQQEELQPVSQPEVELETFDEAEGCKFEATVEVRPEFDPPDHEGIQVTFPEWDVSDEDVEAQLEQMRERFAEVEEVERPAETGDYVTIDITVTVDGEIVEGGEIEDALYEIGSGGVTPQLDEELPGREAGDTFTYTDVLPDEYPEHGGEEAEFEVTVKDVREKDLPDVDDDFAMTASEFDTIEELRKDIRDSLLRRSIMQAQHELRGRIVEAYLANIDVPLPPSMVEAETQQRVQGLERQAEQYGLDADELLQMEDLNREEFEENAEKQAKSSVKATLVLDELSQQLDVEVTDEDVSNEIVRHAQQNGVQPQQIAELIQQQGQVGALIGDIVRRKAIDAIVAAAEIEGGPSQDVLVELGLADAEDEDAEPGLIVPGQGPAAAPEVGPGETTTDSGLIVPGQ